MRNGPSTVTLALAATVLLAGPGCSTSAAGDGGTPGLSDTDACARLAEVQCGLSQRCYPAWDRHPGDECRVQAQRACLARLARAAAGFDGGLVAWNEAALAACELRSKTSACPPALPPLLAGYGVAPLGDCTLDTGLLRGATPPGQTCSDPAECVSGSTCVKPGGVCRGTCVRLSLAGEACGLGCGPGLHCDSSGTCAPLRPLDAPCRGSAECEPDLICLGTCRPRHRPGEPCRFDAQRLSTCEPGLACDVAPWVDGAEGTCVVPAASGERCRFHWSCAAGLVCADLDWSGFPQQAPAPGVCRAPDEEGSNCRFTPWGRFVGDPCQAGLACDAAAQTCQRLPLQGQPCAPSTQTCAGYELSCRPSGTSDVGTCAGPVEVGGRCAFAISETTVVEVPCEAGACDTQGSGTCRPPSRSLGVTCARDGECLSGRCAVQEDRSRRCAAPCEP